MLSTYPLLNALLAEPTVRTDEGAKREVGSLVSTFTALRWIYRSLAESMDAGETTAQQAAATKYLGTRFEKDVIALTRRLVPYALGPVGRLRGLATQAAPSFGIRGGAEDVLLSIIAKEETR